MLRMTVILRHYDGHWLATANLMSCRNRMGKKDNGISR